MSTSLAIPPTVPLVADEAERRLRAVVKRLAELEEERDELIIQMRDAGASLRQIAAVAGMTHVGIKKLLTRHLHPRAIAEIDAELPDDE